jgi:CubicO group peptidase (beta-lactamase class C family)
MTRFAQPNRRRFLMTLAGLPLSFTGRREVLHIPGLSIATYDNGTVLTHAFGRLSAASPALVTSDSLFQAASISKTAAALTVLALARLGKLKLDDDVRSMTRRWTPPDPAPAAGALTLRRLLGMTGGINVPGFSGYAAGAKLPDLAATLAGRPPANNQPITVVARPGSVRAYSGGGYEIIEAALEDGLGASFPDLVTRHVLAPLGMRRSQFAAPLPGGAQAPALAHDDKGQPVAGGFHLYPEHAAAGLWSTPSDLLRIAATLCRAAAGEADSAFTIEQHDQLITSVDGLGYGLGVALGDAEGRLFLFKRGGNFGYRSGLIVFPDAGKAAVVMTNGDNGEALVNETLFALRDRLAWPRFDRLPE